MFKIVVLNDECVKSEDYFGNAIMNLMKTDNSDGEIMNLRIYDVHY